MSNINEEIKAEEQNCQPEENKEEGAVNCDEAASDADANESEKEPEAEASKEEKAEPQEEESVRYMRLMADFQNYKKRADKEKKDLYQYANEKIVTELLTVVDNFERALSQQTADEGYKEGMNLIFKQLGDVLAKAGMEEIPSLGEEFDPNFHNAVMTGESDQYESGKVSEVLQKGYTLNGKVIRPSMVKVVG